MGIRSDSPGRQGTQGQDHQAEGSKSDPEPWLSGHKKCGWSGCGPGITARNGNSGSQGARHHLALARPPIVPWHGQDRLHASIGPTTEEMPEFVALTMARWVAAAEIRVNASM